MDNTLVSRETLEQFIDTLLNQKFAQQPQQSQPTPAERENIRAEAVARLDDEISTAIFSSLTSGQLAELTALFDRDEEDPEVFKNFFDQNHINVQQTVTLAMQNFQQNFLNQGGQND